MILALINWMVVVFFLSLLLAAVYWLTLKSGIFSSIDRYKSLKIGFVALGVLPLLPINDLIVPEKTSTVVATTLSSSAATNIAAHAEERFVDYCIAFVIMAYSLVGLFGLIQYLWSLYSIRSLRVKSEVSGSFRGIPILVRDESVPPATVGAFKPIILINRDVLSSLTETEKDLVLLHELILHRER